MVLRYDWPWMMGETLSSEKRARDECQGWRRSSMTCCTCHGKAAPGTWSSRGWGCPTSQNLFSPLGPTPHGRKEIHSWEGWCGLIHEDASSREAVSRTVVGRVSHCTPKPGIHDGRLACSDLRLASCGLQEEGWVVVRCLPTHVDLSLSHWLSRGATVDGRHTRRSGSPMTRDTDLGIGTSLWERSVLRKPETPAGGLSSQGSLDTRRRGHTH